MKNIKTDWNLEEILYYLWKESNAVRGWWFVGNFSPNRLHIDTVTHVVVAVADLFCLHFAFCIRLESSSMLRYVWTFCWSWWWTLTTYLFIHPVFFFPSIFSLPFFFFPDNTAPFPELLDPLPEHLMLRGSLPGIDCNPDDLSYRCQTVQLSWYMYWIQVIIIKKNQGVDSVELRFGCGIMWLLCCWVWLFGALATRIAQTHSSRHHQHHGHANHAELYTPPGSWY